jgi:DNA-3-methyladenine glycosylase II
MGLKKNAPMDDAFSKQTFKTICDTLAKADKELAHIIQTYGYPPMWTRPNSFETLVHIILEQQVSLASALASLKKLQERTKGLTPRKVMTLSDDEMRACYVSRQKTVYIRGLAEAILKKNVVLEELESLSNDAVRTKLTSLKGIGNWTTDVYLMFVLQRADLFPAGDLAAVNALKRAKALASDTSKDDVVELAAQWKPYRTVATMILWHFYLSSPKGKANMAPVSEDSGY